ncbi:hypothetical protein [Pseudomonas sp. NFX224]|uniref:hypothetical protein n=1 Tax=Pseudomonas sp. NFX224 TaxID=3402862 RepID=UPI003AFAD17A
MVSLRNFYHPLDAAILWSDLEPYEAEIVQTALTSSARLITLFPQWPFLHTYAERIYDAISCHELPATYLGHPIVSSIHAERAFFTIRHTDLRIWIARYFPDEKPSFLFRTENEHSQCVSLGAHLAQEAEVQSSKRVIEELRQKVASLNRELVEKTRQCDVLSGRAQDQDLPTESSKAVFLMIIGALLDCALGCSLNGRVQSIYRNQSAIVEAILCRFPSFPGLSKRTLDRKFAEARRHLSQAS